MHCAYCDHPETKVIDSRLVSSGKEIRRRRVCMRCNERFTTYESVEKTILQVIKKDGSKVAFNPEKIKSGIMKALEKRPIEDSTIADILHQVTIALQNTGLKEISSHSIGEYVMKELKKIDEVAYVRFASVYRSFQNLSAFQKEILSLENEKEP